MNDRTDLTSMLVAVARCYYLENLSQQEIADRLQVSRSLIALYLKKAKEQDIVQIEIIDPRDDLGHFELVLKSKFNLKHITVVPTIYNSKPLTLKSIGSAVAQYLDQTLKDGDILGFSWGRTIMQIADTLAPEKPRRIDVVPLLGESSYTKSYTQLNQIILRVADSFKGSPYFLLAPILVSSRELRNQLMQDVNPRQVAERWNSLTVACVGIGTVPSIEGQVVYIGEEYMNHLLEQGIVGDICARFFNRQGQFKDTEFNDCLIGANLEQLRKTDTVIVVAGGVEKATATLGALRSGLISALFIDEALARILLKE